MFRAATHASLMAVSLLWMAGCDAEVPDVTASVYVPQTIATTTSMAMVPPSDEGRDAAHRHDAPPGDGASGADLPADHPRGPMDGSAAASDEGPDAPGVDHGQTPDSPPPGPTPYAVGPIHSPITATVGDHLRAIAATAPSLNDDLFMKIGASGTVSPNFLSCFSGSNIDWALAASGLADTQAHFLGGDAAGGDPFSRQTIAAKIGMSAGWAISGEPSPIEAEFDALDGPRFALVAYGTNDMHLGTSYQSALWGFGSKLQLLVDTLVSWGVIPILQTNGARLDLPEADRFVETYNTVIRAVAQSRQIPLMDMWAAMSEVPGWGKSGDGLHLNTYPGGACIFDEEGLDYGYNTRNLVTLHGLHRAKLAVVDEEPALNPPPPGISGDGSPDAPFVVDGIPFAGSSDTSASAWSELDAYTGCGSTSDQSGPEDYYTLTLTTATRLRFMLHDEGDVDVDLHLLDHTGSPEGCIQRAHQLIETTLPAGSYTLVVDSWVDGGGISHAGSYLLGIVECHPDDPSCD